MLNADLRFGFSGFVRLIPAQVRAILSFSEIKKLILITAPLVVGVGPLLDTFLDMSGTMQLFGLHQRLLTSSTLDAFSTLGRLLG